ncbi:Acetylcholinesterase [Araneus ventricosus]|uniref:Acetylcholinesterase n=1 Tax=Araneus ventricosus TaxID=182803 RepID=A0A4Y2G675_ARAVE|nr:Acetylcholinesterase [Araneus ventricosus]
MSPSFSNLEVGRSDDRIKTIDAPSDRANNYRFNDVYFESLRSPRDQIFTVKSSSDDCTSHVVLNRCHVELLSVPRQKEDPHDIRRFRKPEAVEAWTEPLQCKDMPNACVQYMAYPFPWAMSPHDPHISEDCLYLNIWVPNDASPQNKKQVFFFIHGGGFFTGSIRQPIYDGRALAGLGDVIVVTTNYRLGTLGFWSNNGIDAPGNVGKSLRLYL